MRQFPDHYPNYVGQYVKRFYAPFRQDTIFKITGFRHDKAIGHNDVPFDVPMYQYTNSAGESWWADCEDSCIITNELPIKNIAWVANVNDPAYRGYNPFTGLNL